MNLQLTTYNSQRGQILVISVIFLTVMLVLMGSLLGFVGQNVLGTRKAVAAEQALQLADAGVERAIWQLNETAGAYVGETDTGLGATGAFDVSVADLSASIKEITATGYAPNKANPRATRQVKVQVSIDTSSVSFHYGVQVGEGGLSMAQDSTIQGNVYSNGIIDGATGAQITGDAYSAGAAGRIQNMSIGGNAYSHTIQDTTIGGSAYGYAFSSGTAGGNVKTYSLSSCTIGGNAWYTTKSSCTIGGEESTPYAGESDAPAEPFPITDEQIASWKNQAAAGGTISGNYNIGGGGSVTLGPKKITGNLTAGIGAILTLTGPLWVQGSININKDATVVLDPSYGNNSEVLLADGDIDLSKEVNFQRAGPASYILGLSLSSSGSAMSIAKSADALIAYAPNGTVNISKTSTLREVTAWKLSLAKDCQVIYESGLANLNFQSGPGGSWALVRGTWREVK